LTSQLLFSQEFFLNRSLAEEISSGKMLVICLSPEDTFRTNFENMMKHSLSFHAVPVTSSNSLLPQKMEPSPKVEKALANLISSLSEKHCSSLMVSAVTDVETTKNADGYLYDEFTIYHFTTNVYKIEKEKLTLIWEMCLSLYGIQLQHMSTIDIVNAIVDQLTEDEIIPPKISFTHEVFIFR
jgi:hypothetical protein